MTPGGRYPGGRVKQLKVRSVDSSEIVFRALRFQLMYVSQIGSSLGLRLGFGYPGRIDSGLGVDFRAP